MALILALFLEWLGGFPLVATAFLVLAAGGVWSIRCLPDRGDCDAPEIVIDEMAGQFLAILPVSAALLHVDASLLSLWPGWIAAFVLFRFFDIVKPWPIRLCDRRNGALWIMMDDIVAGAFAGLITLLLAWGYHGE